MRQGKEVLWTSTYSTEMSDVIRHIGEDATLSYPIEKMNLKSNEYILNDKHRILVHIHIMTSL